MEISKTKTNHVVNCLVIINLNFFSIYASNSGPVRPTFKVKYPRSWSYLRSLRLYLRFLGGLVSLVTVWCSMVFVEDGLIGHARFYHTLWRFSRGNSVIPDFFPRSLDNFIYDQSQTYTLSELFDLHNTTTRFPEMG